MMSFWGTFLFVIIGTLIQGAVLVFSRKYGTGFLMLIPLIVAHQYLFLTAYTKAENFTLTWFLSVALTSSAAVIIGTMFFQDAFTWKAGFGIVLILLGVVLTKI